MTGLAGARGAVGRAGFGDPSSQAIDIGPRDCDRPLPVQRVTDGTELPALDEFVDVGAGHAKQFGRLSDAHGFLHVPSIPRIVNTGDTVDNIVCIVYTVAIACIGSGE